MTGLKEWVGVSGWNELLCEIKNKSQVDNILWQFNISLLLCGRWLLIPLENITRFHLHRITIHFVAK